MTHFSVGALFLMGIIASLSTTMATSGGLFLATIGTFHADASWKVKIIPTASFNIARVCIYSVMGALNGYIGQFISKQMNSNIPLNTITGIFMIIFGLDMLGLFPFKKLLPESWFVKQLRKIEESLSVKPVQTSFLLGIFTYWLPCAFTNTVQFYAIGIADPLKGAVAMGIFALGTTPVLFTLGFVSTMMKTTSYAWFMKGIGILLTGIGCYYMMQLLLR